MIDPDRLTSTFTAACAALLVTACGGSGHPPVPGSVRLGFGVSWAQAPATCGDFDIAYEFAISVDGRPLPARHPCPEAEVLLTNLAPGAHVLECRLWFLKQEMALPPVESTLTVASGQETPARCDFAPVRHTLRAVWTLNGGAAACPPGAQVDLQETGVPGIAGIMSWAAVTCVAGEAFADFPEGAVATWQAHFWDPAHPFEAIMSAARSPVLGVDPNLTFDIVVPWL